MRAIRGSELEMDKQGAAQHSQAHRLRQQRAGKRARTGTLRAVLVPLQNAPVSRLGPGTARNSYTT